MFERFKEFGRALCGRTNNEKVYSIDLDDNHIVLTDNDITELAEMHLMQTDKEYQSLIANRRSNIVSGAWLTVFGR